ERQPRDQVLILAYRAEQPVSDLLAVLLLQQPASLEVALTEIGPGVVEGDRPVLLEVQNHPVRRGSAEREARDLELAERVAEGAAPVGLLHAAGERALAADARAVGVGKARAGKGSGREDQRILRPERIHGAGVQLQQR